MRPLHQWTLPLHVVRGRENILSILSMHNFHSSTDSFVLPPTVSRSGYPHAERDSASSRTVGVLHRGFFWAISHKQGSSLFFLLSSIVGWGSVLPPVPAGDHLSLLSLSDCITFYYPIIESGMCFLLWFCWLRSFSQRTD